MMQGFTIQKLKNMNGYQATQYQKLHGGLMRSRHMFCRGLLRLKVLMTGRWWHRGLGVI